MTLRYFYLTEYVEPPERGFQLATAAVMFCGLCGDMIDGMGGPGPNICDRCGDAFNAGHLKGCVRWDGPEDREIQNAGNPYDPEEWLSIDTAPKDGTYILAYPILSEASCVVVWEKAENGGYWRIPMTSKPAPYRPVKWMPLPSNPERSSANPIPI
jgi:hypothetical protein